MTYCILIIALSFVAMLLSLLPFYADKLLGLLAEKWGLKKICGSLCKVWVIMMFIGGFLLGALLLCCYEELWALISDNLCKKVLFFGLLALLLLLYFYARLISCCNSNSLGIKTGGSLAENLAGLVRSSVGRLMLMVGVFSVLLFVVIVYCCLGSIAAGHPGWTLCQLLLIFLLIWYLLVCLLTYFSNRYCDTCTKDCSGKKLQAGLWIVVALLAFLTIWSWICCSKLHEGDYDLAMVGIWWEGKNEGEMGAHLRWSFRTTEDNGTPLDFPQGGFDIQRRVSGTSTWTTINSEPIFPIKNWGDEANVTGDMAISSATERLHADSWDQFRDEPVQDLLETLAQDHYATQYYIEEPDPAVYSIAPANPYGTEADRDAYLNSYYNAGSEESPNPPLAYWDMVPMDTMMMSAMHSEVARLLGLYYLDRDADPNVEYDYRVVGYWNDSTRRYTAPRISKANTIALNKPYITTIDSPVPVGKINGVDLLDDQSVAMSWTPHANENPPVVSSVLDSIESILYNVEHKAIYTVDDDGIEDLASLGGCSVPASADGFEPARRYSKVSGSDEQNDILPPVLVAPLEDENTGALSWPQYFFYHRNLQYGCHGYRVIGVDIFGRTSPESDIKVEQLNDLTPPPPPSLVEVKVYQRKDPNLPENIRDTFFTADTANGETEADLPDYSFVVSWVWPEQAQLRAPDLSHFYIYANLPDFEPFPGEGPSLDPPAWKDKNSWDVKAVNGVVSKDQFSDLPDRYGSLDYLSSNDRYYEVTFTNKGLESAGITIADMGLQAGDDTPVKYTYFGVAAVDRMPYENHGDVSAPVFAVARDLDAPDAPEAPSLASGPFEANKQGNRSLVLDWAGDSLYKYALYRTNVDNIDAGEVVDVTKLPACFTDEQPTRSADMSEEDWQSALNDYRVRALAAINANDLRTSGIVKRISPILLAPESNTASFTDALDATFSSEQLYFATTFDKAGNESLLSCPSEIILIEDGVPPRIPVIRSIASGDNEIAITWNTNLEPDLAHYNIYRTDNTDYLNTRRKMEHIASLKPDGMDDSTLEPNSNNATRQGSGDYAAWTLMDDTVQPLKNYYYRIEAVDTVGNRSKLSNQTRAAAYDKTKPDTPDWADPGYIVNLSGGEVTIELKWHPIADDPDLRTLVQRKKVGDALWRTIGGWNNSDVHTLVDSDGLETNTSYQYRLRAMDKSGNRSNLAEESLWLLVEVGE